MASLCDVYTTRKRSRPMRLSPKYRDKFEDSIDRSGGPDACWPWLGSKNTSGYGLLGICEGSDRTYLLAHRIAWSTENGDIPTDKIIRHRCHNRPCCNPAHLLVGTHKDNYDDMVAAGRQGPAPLLGVKGTAHPRSLYDDAVRDRAIELWRVKRLPRTEIAKALGCHRWSVSRWIADYETARSALLGE